MAAASIDRIGRKQFGLITRAQALAIMSERSLEWLLQRERLCAVHVGVYRVAGAPTTPEQCILAAVLASPGRAFASHASAAYLHGLLPPPAFCDVTVDRESSNKRQKTVVHRSPLKRSHVTTLNGIPVTTVERTVVDCAGFLSLGLLARVIDDAVVAGKTSFQQIANVLADAGTRGRKGAKNLRVLLVERLELPSGSESSIELKVLRAARLAGVPRPVCQYPLRIHGRRRRLDAAWPDYKVGVESDGFSVHGRSRKRFEDDRDRNNALALAGWTILHFTARSSTADIASALKSAIRRTT